jgi:NADPH2:quinone reductase
MKAWQVNAWGEPESMVLAEVPAAMPGPRQVLVRNRAAALNFFDILQIQGKYQFKPPFPFTPGAEVAGLVEAVGSDVMDFQPGDAVLSLAHGAGLAEYTLTEAERTFPVPPGMGFPEAAAMPIVYHTMYYALRRRATVRPGDWLLVHAGASGVGMAAIQLGKAFGALVIATAGSPAKLAFAREQGADHVIDYRNESWPEEVKQLTGGRGADLICDAVGGDVFDLSTKCIASEGSLLVIGFAGGRIPSIQANRILLKNISVIGVFWGDHSRRNPAYVAEVQRELASLYAGGRIHPVVARTYPLEAAPAALRDLADRKVLGKAVLVME